MSEITCKNDLYAHLGNELSNNSGISYGTLDRVRAGYDRCEFTVNSGKRVTRSVDEVLTHIRNGAEFEN